MNAIVIGAGVVGSAIAYGMARRGIHVVVLDGDDGDYRAARANFGLVWLQGKGMNMPAYQLLTRQSVDLWPEFHLELLRLTGIDTQYERNGGITFCLGSHGYEKRYEMLQRLHSQLTGEDADFEMIDRTALEKIAPRAAFGPDICGASFGRRDGHTNPLKLLAALHAGIVRHGGRGPEPSPGHTHQSRQLWFYR